MERAGNIIYHFQHNYIDDFFWIFCLFHMVYNHGQKLNNDVVFHLKNGKCNLDIPSKIPVYFLLYLANPCCHMDTVIKKMHRVHIWKKGPKMTKLKFVDLFSC